MTVLGNYHCYNTFNKGMTVLRLELIDLIMAET